MSAAAPPVIEARSVRRVLEGAVPVTLVEHIDLAVAAGEFVAITGPSGSGKSSLLYLLGLLDRPTAGTVMLESRDTGTVADDELDALRLNKLGFIFQFHFLLPEFTSMENVMIPMRKLGRLPARAMRERAETILTELGLKDHLHKRPDQMSGGQRQRVAIARALANDPLVILADESTGNLDSVNSIRVFETFQSLAHDRGRAVIAVTHELNLADMSDRHVTLVDGRIASAG